MAGCADQVKRVTLELGGKSANIVFADADLEKAAAEAPYGVFDNAGQDCCARSRILVERSAYDRFMELLEPAVKDFEVGDPSDPATEMGPLISPRSARAGRVLCRQSVAFQGHGADWPGVLVPTDRARTGRRPRDQREEIFGPVVVGDPVRRTRRTRCGSRTTASTGCPARSGPGTSAARCGSRRGVEAGNLSVNSHSSVRYSTPFGGFKQSGLGRELGPDALAAFTETKNIFISTED